MFAKNFNKKIQVSKPISLKNRRKMIFVQDQNFKALVCFLCGKFGKNNDVLKQPSWRFAISGATFKIFIRS